MPPLTQSQSTLPSSRHASTSVAHKGASHDTDELRAAVQEALTNFVTDTMYDKPEHIYEYMAEWARKQQLAAKEKQRSSLSPTPPPRSTAVAARPAARALSTEPARRAATPESVHADTLDDAADQILTLAQHRQQHFHDKAEGCKDHYLMAMEDSDGDIFHINALQKKMTAARKAELDAKHDTAAVTAKLQEIDESEASEEAKAQKKKDLLHTYEHLWENDVPKGHLN